MHTSASSTASKHERANGNTAERVTRQQVLRLTKSYHRLNLVKPSSTLLLAPFFALGIRIGAAVWVRWP